MKKNRFASYLLTGKAATLPFMFNSSFADVVPTYTDLLSNRATLIEVPATGVRLFSIFKDNNTNNNSNNNNNSNLAGGSFSSGSSYGGVADADAALCSTNLPSSMNIVITGAKPGDTVYLVASSTKDDGSFDSLNPKIRLGSKNFSVVTSFTLAKSIISENGGSYANSTSPISIPIALSNNAFVKGGTFYFQAVIFPNLNSQNIWEKALYSELDQITVSTAGCPSTSGSTYGSGSAY